ncbi:hypothetical protein [Paeniglutamicibacter antarcticus]|uniref:Lipoprotein n=1 Tax=Paeniglutamicibacter antarcticus TaxID=494023 RepID=A0ABP9TMR2_9MICC
MTLLTAFLVSGCTPLDQPDSESPQASSSKEEAPKAMNDPVSGTYTGTQTIQLGPPPEGAKQISVELGCIDAGTLLLQDGAKTICTEKGSEGAASTTTLTMAPGQDGVVVKTNDPTVSYKVNAFYKN